MIDYPIDTSHIDGDVVYSKLGENDAVVLKSAPRRVHLDRQLIEQVASAGRATIFELGDVGYIELRADNGAALYRIVQWRPETWSYECVLEAHRDSDGTEHKATLVLDTRTVSLRKIL